MEKRKYYKIIFAFIIVSIWMIFFTGLVRLSAQGWLLLTIVTLIIYLVSTKFYFRRKSIKDTINKMEVYMENRAKENLGGSNNKEDIDCED